MFVWVYAYSASKQNNCKSWDKTCLFQDRESCCVLFVCLYWKDMAFLKVFHFAMHTRHENESVLWVIYAFKLWGRHVESVVSKVFDLFNFGSWIFVKNRIVLITLQWSILTKLLLENVQYNSTQSQVALYWVSFVLIDSFWLNIFSILNMCQ